MTNQPQENQSCKTCSPEPWKAIPVEDVYNPVCSDCGKEILKPSQGWEGEFDKRWMKKCRLFVESGEYFETDEWKNIKDFIRTLLHKERKRVLGEIYTWATKQRCSCEGRIHDPEDLMGKLLEKLTTLKNQP
jgi:hypothetical protein